jgi:hypothetical protein
MYHNKNGWYCAVKQREYARRYARSAKGKATRQAHRRREEVQAARNAQKVEAYWRMTGVEYNRWLLKKRREKAVVRIRDRSSASSP